MGSGPDEIRTRDLLNAIQTRSQLRHRPMCLMREVDYNDSDIHCKTNSAPLPSAGEQRGKGAEERLGFLGIDGGFVNPDFLFVFLAQHGAIALNECILLLLQQLFAQ